MKDWVIEFKERIDNLPDEPNATRENIYRD
jgi:hypothetical protein